MDKKIQNIINIVRYTPAVFILILSILSAYYLSSEHINNLKEEKLKIKQDFIKSNKETIQITVDNTISKYIKKSFKNSEELLKKDLKRKINTVYTISMNIYNKNKDTLPKEEIIKHIKNAIETLRFNEGRGYFSIHTMKGINILQPITKSFEGTSVLNRKDAKGTYTVREAISIAESKGEGFMRWYSLKPGNLLDEYEKVGFIKKFEPYDLIFTTAEFIDDFENQMKKKILDHLSNIKYRKNEYIFVLDYKSNLLLSKNRRFDGLSIRDTEKYFPIKVRYNDFINSKEKSKFIEYKVEDNKDKEYNKLGYFKKMESLSWVVGTGFNLDEVNTIIKKEQEFLDKEYDKHLNTLLITFIFITILLLMISYYIAKVLEKKFLNYKENVEEQIKENKTQKETLLKAQKIAKIGEYTLDLETNVAQWSDSMIKLFGIEGSKEKPGPEFLKKIMHDEDWHCFESSLQKCMKDKVQHLCRYRIKRPIDEKVVWIECRGELSDENTLVGTVQDISEGKTFEDKLRRERDRSEHYLDVAGSIIVALDKNGIITLINKSGCKLLEDDEKNIIGKSWFDNFVNSDELSFVKDVFSKIMTGHVENVKYVENSILSSKDNIHTITWNNSITYDENGNITGLLSSGIDITHEKEIEEENKKKNEFIYNFTENANAIVCIVDDKGRMIRINKKGREFTGYTEEELSKIPFEWLKLVPENLRVKVKQFAKLAKYDKLPLTYENPWISKDGDSKTFQWSNTLFKKNDGSLDFILSIGIDVSYKKLLEEQSRLASMGQMIGNIAHQWRQPLNVITTSASAIKLDNELNTLNPKELNKSLDVITNQAYYLSATIDNFKNFVKGDKEYRNTSIVKTLEETIDLTKASLKNNYIKVVTDFQEDLLIKCSKNELIEGLINIINNSKDVLKDNVEHEDDRFIFICTRKLEENKIRILIKDSGGGIAEDILNRVFEPYFTTKHQSQGTGLGLQITDKIIRERLNGEITVYNEITEYNNNEYKGACFSIILTQVS